LTTKEACCLSFLALSSITLTGTLLHPFAVQNAEGAIGTLKKGVLLEIWALLAPGAIDDVILAKRRGFSGELEIAREVLRGSVVGAKS